MITINKNIQSEILMTTMEEIVPEDSLFRKIDKYIDFTFIYDKVKDLYCENNGRPSIDPVVLFKIVFIQALDGIKSMRQTCKKLKVDAEYRWFLGIPFGQDTPHFSTFSKNSERRFKDSDIFEEIFVEIVNQAIKYKLVDGTTFYTDSTHKKANANKNKFGFELKKYAVDSGYLTLDIKKYFIENDIFGVLGYRRYGTPESRKEKSKYKYEKELDMYYEKETGEILEYKGLIDKNGYKKYENTDKTKIVRRHIHEEWNEIFRENRLSKEGKELYQKRKEHIERSFADSKQNHGYRYAMYKGVKKNQHYTWLICAAQNMKNIAIKNDNVGKEPVTSSSFLYNFTKIIKNIISLSKKIYS